MQAVDILALCQSHEDTLRSKGYFNPNISVEINFSSLSPYRTVVYYYHWEGFQGQESFTLRNDVPSVLFSDLAQAIADLPSVLDLKRKKFVETLAHLVEDARDLEIPVTIDLDAMLNLARNHLLEHHA